MCGPTQNLGLTGGGGGIDTQENIYPLTLILFLFFTFFK